MSEDLIRNEVDAVMSTAECIYSAEEVDAALDKMASNITEVLADQAPLVLCTMIGGIVTTGKLIQRLSFPLTIDYIHATRYRGALRGADLHWIARPTESLVGRVVLIVDDIFDEGLTLEALIKECISAGAKKVYSAILIDKDCDKKSAVQVDFMGLTVENRYVFGSGMDYKGYLRNAPGIFAVTKTE